ncbi:MAG: nucleotide exchange factor GrpE [Acidobacteria bacterium]|nr:nucleotide exchange factor GrpE [Acidobacteriota bacterium]
MSMSELKVTDRRFWVRGEEAGGDTAPGSLKPTYVEELEARLAAKDSELQQLLARYRSATDEFEQARARLRKEVAKDVERGRRAMLGGFLEVLDNLDRALAAASGRTDEPFVQGVSLVRQQFLNVLDGLGIARIDPIGQPFDPAVHEAVASTPADDSAPPGRITGVIRPGYLIGGEVLRPAMVAVAS